MVDSKSRYKLILMIIQYERLWTIIEQMKILACSVNRLLRRYRLMWLMLIIRMRTPCEVIILSISAVMFFQKQKKVN